MTEWKEHKLGEVIKTNVESIGKDYPYSKILYLDTGSITRNNIDQYQEFELDKAPSRAKRLVKQDDIIYSSVRPNQLHYGYITNPANNLVVSTGFVTITCNKAYIEPKFLYYYLTQENITEYLHSVAEASTSAYPSLKPSDIEFLDISLPPLPEQIRIASILSSLDDKIDLLHRENKTLEAMAETLFRQWFIEEAKEDWEEIPFGEVIEIFDSKRKPLSKMERDKMKNGTIFYPYYGAAEIMDYIDSYLFDGEFILMGEDGTVKTDDGYPILQYVSGKFWPNNHAHVLKAKPPYNNCFIWNYLKTTNIEYIVTGAVQPKINQANLLSLPFYKYPDDLLEEYKSVTQNVWEKTMNNNKQIQTLIQQRDSLLPKLMSGEVKI